MNVNFKKTISALSGCAVMALASMTFAADQPPPTGKDPNATPNTTRSNTVAPHEQARPAVAAHGFTHAWRASQLEKLNVRNDAGDKIGAIEDLVISPDGRVAYVALGFGGFLGMGEKLFAVPWNSLRFHRADNANNENFVVLNVTKDELNKMPGFDKNHWPDFADPNFTKEIDQYYHNHPASNRLGQR